MKTQLPRNPGKILVIKPSSLGDIVHSMPFLEALRTKFPAAAIHWVVAREFLPLLEGHPMIDRLWIMDKSRWKDVSHPLRNAREIVTFALALRRERFDLVVDLSGLLRSGLVACATGCRYRLGFANSDEGSPYFYTHLLHEEKREAHAVDRNLALAHFLGCPPATVRFPLAPAHEDSEILTRLPPSFYVLAPSAGKAANQWPAERFGELARRLPLPAVVLASKNDEAAASTVCRISGDKAINLAGRTAMADLAPVIGRARFMLSNDTGPMHIAAALGIPVVAIFGPANPVRTGPYGPIHTVVRRQLDCSPCYRHKACQGWRCMLDITVSQVENLVLEKFFA